MDNSIPWDEIFSTELKDTTQNIAGIMAGYCESIEEQTNKVVHARYEELKLERRPANGIAAFASTLSQSEEAYQVNALPQEDINRIYDSATYVFDVYNETYQFRLCELVYGARYPVEITIDEGIEKELHGTLRLQYQRKEHDGAYIVVRDDALEKCFRLMFTSQKARYIFGQLCKA